MNETEKRKAKRYAKMKQTILERYGADYYSRNGKLGGQNGNNRPFRDRSLASKAGFKSWENRRTRERNKSLSN